MKIKVSKRAIEARIKRMLFEENKKLKKKASQYTIVDLDKGIIDRVFDDFAELAVFLNCLENWEEIDFINPGTVSIEEVTMKATGAALQVIDAALGVVYSDADNELLNKLHDIILEALTEIKKSGAYPKNINLID